MKINQLILGIFLFPICLFAQETNSTKKHNIEFAINASRFVNDVFSLNNRAVDAGPYIFQFKFFKGTTAFRLGLGGNYQRSKNNDAVFVVRDDSDTRADIRLGFEKHVPLASKWDFYYGIDALYQYLKTETSVISDVDVVTTSIDSPSLGGGPIFGVQYRISSRIVLWTEASIYYSLSQETETTNSQNFPNFNEERKRENHFVTPRLPIALFFAIQL